MKTKTWMKITITFTVLTGTYAAYSYIKLPVINNRPEKFISISGTINPKLSVKIHSVYTTHNRRCLQVDNWLEGAFSPRQKTFTTTLKPINNKYQTKAVFDQLKKGFCHWQLNSIYYEVKLKYSHYKKYDSLLAIYNKANKTDNLNIECNVANFPNNYKRWTCALKLNQYSIGLQHAPALININFKYKGDTHHA